MNTEKNPMDEWLKNYPPPSAVEREKSTNNTGKNPVRFSNKIDLHGMTRDIAVRQLQNFINNSVRAGLRKVLVIHGRGLNSDGEAILPKVVRAELERNPYVIDFGAAEPDQGGTGAMQVFLRR